VSELMEVPPVLHFVPIAHSPTSHRLSTYCVRLSLTHLLSKLVPPLRGRFHSMRINLFLPLPVRHLSTVLLPVAPWGLGPFACCSLSQFPQARRSQWAQACRAMNVKTKVTTNSGLISTRF